MKKKFITAADLVKPTSQVPILSNSQIEKIAIQAIKNALKNRKPDSLVKKIQRAQDAQVKKAEHQTTRMNYPKAVNGVSFLIPVPNHFACSGGGRVLHWLAAMMAETGAAVATTEICVYNPMLPVRRRALPGDIAILSDGRRFNDVGAVNVVWWVLFFAGVFFKSRIPKNEACFVYEPEFFDSAAACCDRPISREENIFYLPHIDPMGCYPGRKTIESCVYGEDAANKSSITSFSLEKGLNPMGYMPTKKSELDSRLVPGAVVMPAKSDVFRDGLPHHEYLIHQRTLAILRAAKNFYTVDHYTAMSVEAALCGCKVWYIQQDGSYKEHYVSKQEMERHVMNPARDVRAVELFRQKILKFFGR